MDMMDVLKQRLLQRQSVMAGKDLDKGPPAAKAAEGPKMTFNFKDKMKSGVNKVMEENRKENPPAPQKFAEVVKMAQVV
jgi:hypothetical protein